MADYESLTRQLRELEESLLVANVRKSGRVDELLKDNFVEFGSSGRTYTKTELIAALQKEVPVVFTAREFKVEVLAPSAALVTYCGCRQSVPPVHALRSSIWQLEQGQWRMVFHQATLTSAG